MNKPRCPGCGVAYGDQAFHPGERWDVMRDPATRSHEVTHTIEGHHRITWRVTDEEEMMANQWYTSGNSTANVIAVTTYGSNTSYPIGLPYQQPAYYPSGPLMGHSPKVHKETDTEWLQRRVREVTEEAFKAA